MSTNRDLLKEAIADAKAVKETALANAKAALEEAFTPQIKSMLAAQILAEEEEEDEDDLAEADKVRMGKDEMEEGYGMEDTNEAEELDEEFDLEEILAELELEEGDDDTMEEEMDAPHGNINADMDPDTGFLEEEINLDEMDEDELKALIEDVIEDMIESGELEAGGDPVEFSDEEEGEEEGGEEMEMGAEEEVELDENILAKAKGIAKGIGKSLIGFPEDVYNEAMAKLKANPELKDNKEFMAMLNAAKNFAAAAGAAASAGADIGTKSFKEAKSEELEEALEAIETLKQELSEVNLLNSKLLYVNKIFRNKNLTESQKVKVLSAFDKATSVKETKIIYETLNEGLVSKTNAKSSIKESLGMASKPAGVAPKQPIVESDQMVQRFQKLAGIL
jgi:hypothetical protein